MPKISVSKKLFLILSACILLADGCFVLLNYIQDKRTFEKEIHEQSKRLKTGFDVAFSLTTSNMSQIATYVANNSKVQKIFAEASKAHREEGGKGGGEKSASLRVKLYEEVANSWEFMNKKHSVRQLHFHLGPPDTSFLRVHKLSKWGDDLSDVRYLINDLFEEQASKEGFELGRIYAGIRGAVPVYAPNSQGWNGEFIGVLEAGTSFKDIVGRLKQQTGAEVAVLLNRNKVAEVKWNAKQDRDGPQKLDKVLRWDSRI